MPEKSNGATSIPFLPTISSVALVPADCCRVGAVVLLICCGALPVNNLRRLTPMRYAIDGLEFRFAMECVYREADSTGLPTIRSCLHMFAVAMNIGSATWCLQAMPAANTGDEMHEELLAALAASRTRIHLVGGARQPAAAEARVGHRQAHPLRARQQQRRRAPIAAASRRRRPRMQRVSKRCRA